MRIDKKNKNIERRILTGMIVDDIVLGQISSKWNPQMFKSTWANLIAKWCLKYYRKYKKAPRIQIEGLYEQWATQTRDKNTVEIVDRFLSSLSNEYEDLKKESNSGYIIDLAGKYFNRIKIERLIETIQDDIDGGHLDEAHTHLSSYSKVEMGVGEGIDVFQDEEIIREAFADKREPLIEFRGALGKFFSRALERDALIAFIGPEKRGKSFWLLEIAFQAVYQRRKVAFFDAGDMSKNQVMKRFMIRAARHPAYSCRVKYPKRIYRNKKGKVFIPTKKKVFKSGLTWRRAKKACDLIMKKKVKSKESYFKLSPHANSTLSVSMLQSILEDWEKENWVPDVIVIDYADILNMDYPGMEGREKINETWKQLRCLSQKYHCLVVTATQSDSASYSKRLIDMGNFSEDKRKAGHVTGMVGLNQNAREKNRGVMRLNWAVDMRDNKSNVRKCVYVAECRLLANVAVRSCW